MKRLMFLSGILFGAEMAGGFSPDAGSKRIESFGNWESAGSSSGVSTWVRWIRYSDGSKTRERMGEFTIAGTLNGAVGVLSDPVSMKKWVSGVRESYRLDGNGSREWGVYTLYDLPWPFHERDLVSLYSLSMQKDNKEAVIRIHSIPLLIPQRPGVERLKDYNANWTLREDGKGKVHIRFTAMSDTPPLFPRPIQDPVIESVFHRNLVSLRRLMSEQVQG